MSSTEMVTEIPRSPSIYVQQENVITEKRKIVKSNLQIQAFKVARLAREKFPQGKVRGRCDSRNIFTCNNGK